MTKVGFYREDNAVPLEMHKVRIVQKLTLRPLEERMTAMADAGYNTFLCGGAEAASLSAAGRRAGAAGAGGLGGRGAVLLG